MSIQAGKCGRFLTLVVLTGQLLRPDEDTVSARRFVIDDERRTETLEVVNRKLEVLEIEPATIEVHARTA